MHGDDGLVLRLPDVDLDSGAPPDVADLVLVDPDDVESLVTEQIGGSALFAARFRECAARALLLPRRRPGGRSPLWQQRQRAAQLLEVASRYATFPIVLETVRECLQDVFDVPGLVELMRDLAARRVRLVEVETREPSPFARSLLFGYVAQFLYEGDSPLAERRAAALALDPTLLAELLGRGEGAALRDLLDPDAITRTERELQRLDPERQARHAEDVADLLRALGPLSTQEVAARAREPQAAHAWLTELEDARRVIAVRVAGDDRWASVEDAGRLLDALGTALPVGVPEVFREPVADPLADLLARYARTHGPFTVAEAAHRFGLGTAVAATTLARLVADGRLVEGELRPGGQGLELCDAQVLRTIRRRSLAALRHEVEPVGVEDLVRFLPPWQGVGGRLHGTDGLVRVVEQLAGAVLPASAVESLVLPSRVVGWRPSLLDEVMATGEVLWCGHGALPGDDGWVSLHLADTAHLTLPEPAELELSSLHERLLAVLGSGGAFFFGALADSVDCHDPAELETALWDLVWSGRVTGDTLAGLRARLAGGRTTHRARATGPRSSRYGMRARRPRGTATRAAGPPTTAGRWSLLPAVDPDPTVRAAALAETLLDRHGVVTRGAVMAEHVAGGFAAVYRVLSAFEDAGRVRRGYFVEHLGAAQFATAGAVDRLRGMGAPAPRAAPPTSLWDVPPPPATAPALVLSASDPANPFGAALPWPEREPAAGEEGTTSGSGHRPGRKAGALVVLLDGALVLYVERGGRTLLSFTDDPQQLAAAADALALAVRDGALGRLTVERTDGEAVLGSESGLAAALEGAGFRATPRGLRLRA
jgi:ATP-dependent Lhr-like helicase